MKYHKIRGVALTECTAEQKIAYNLAFRWRDIIKKQYATALCGVARAECVRGYVRLMLDSYRRDYPDSRYNIDAIFCALGAGLENYIKREGSGILGSYKEIGDAFPALYLAQPVAAGINS